MDESTKPAGDLDPANPFETEEHTVPVEPAEPAISPELRAAIIAEQTRETGTPSPASETTAAPAGLGANDPWVERPPVIVREPAPTPLALILVLGILFLLAAASAAFLLVHNLSLEARLKATAQHAAELQAQLDHSSSGSDKSASLRIVSALYGSGAHFADVTERVSDLLSKPDTEIWANPGSLKADPTPGWNKTLAVVYEYRWQRHIFVTGEGGRVTADLLQQGIQ